MSFLDFINQLIQGDKKNSQDKVKKQRSKLKDEIMESLRKRNYTDIEIIEVVHIIDVTEKRIEKLKSKLIGTNITRVILGENSDYPADFVNDIYKQIEEERIKMDKALRDKVNEIDERKKFDSGIS